MLCVSLPRGAVGCHGTCDLYIAVIIAFPAVTFIHLLFDSLSCKFKFEIQNIAKI